MEPPHYTIRTLDALKAREPENDFTLVIGADNLAGIKRWKDAERILQDYGVAVYPRKGYDLAEIHRQLIKDYLDSPKPYVLDWNEDLGSEGSWSFDQMIENVYNIRIIDAPIVDISSTEIREGQLAGKDMSAYLM